jgi:hypothetical protein
LSGSSQKADSSGKRGDRGNHGCVSERMD